MKIYNSLTRKKEEFVPLKPGKVSMYVCGPTVYNYFHIGNGRTFIVFDTIRRYMEYRGYEVNFVQNFTDIDDIIFNTFGAVLGFIIFNIIYIIFILFIIIFPKYIISTKLGINLIIMCIDSSKFFIIDLNIFISSLF